FNMGDSSRADKGAGASWRFKPYIGGGIGTVYIDSDANIDNNALGFGGNDWVFGYQFMAGLEYEIADNWFLSVSYRFLGLTEATLDELKIGGVPVSQLSLDLDKTYVKIEDVYNHSLQFGLRIEF
ncbi:MAG: outer membrane beta-barrel protein, partial [Phycisphaerales bacterium]|nr:outer membrane beta-barrel protein [Phycisphaerales bacterium]